MGVILKIKTFFSPINLQFGVIAVAMPQVLLFGVVENLMCAIFLVTRSIPYSSQIRIVVTREIWYYYEIDFFQGA